MPLWFNKFAFNMLSQNDHYNMDPQISSVNIRAREDAITSTQGLSPQSQLLEKFLGTVVIHKYRTFILYG